MTGSARRSAGEFEEVERTNGDIVVAAFAETKGAQIRPTVLVAGNQMFDDELSGNSFLQLTSLFGLDRHGDRACIR